MLVELEPQELGARVDLVAVDARGEGRLLELLLDGLRLERVDPVGPDEPAGVHEAGELVAGEERPLELRVPRHLEVLGVGEDGLDDLVGPALLAQDRGAVLGVLVERRMHLVVEVVEERDRAPELLVLPDLAGVPADAGLHGEGVTAERLALRVAGQGLPGAVSGHVHRAG